MKVTLAKFAGFCFGVKRAVDMVYEQIEKETGPIYTYGPIIHNEEVVAELEAKGVVVIPEDSSLDDYAPGTVIMRSHGVSRAVVESLEAQGMTVVDATCPFVKKIHRYVEEYSKKGYHIVVIGNASHPEVQGIIGWMIGEEYTVISSAEEMEAFAIDQSKPICLVSQTTYNLNKFHELVEIMGKKEYDVLVLNTICNATEERQKAAAELAKESDAMIVIGGKHSSNTQKLFEICKNECEATYYIQTLDDLNGSLLPSNGSLGITAGASTPNNIIEEVQTYVRNEF